MRVKPFKIVILAVWLTVCGLPSLSCWQDALAESATEATQRFITTNTLELTSASIAKAAITSTKLKAGLVFAIFLERHIIFIFRL